MANLWIIPLAIIGLIISLYIYSSKKKNEKIVCVLGGSCDKVIGSKYSRTFGMPNEVGGIIYFIIIILLSILSIMGLENIFYFSIVRILIVISSLAALFSLYLLGIQAFVLKEWCEYCTATSIITFLILILSFFYG